VFRNECSRLTIQDEHQDSMVLVKILANLVGAAFFHTEYELPNLPQPSNKSNDPPFAQDLECINRVNDILSGASLDDCIVSSLPLYYWVIFLQKWASMFQETPTGSFDFLTSSKLEHLAGRALIGLGVLNMMADSVKLFRLVFKGSPDAGFDDEVRVFLLQVLSYSVDAGIILYNEDVFGTLLAVLDSEQPYSIPDENRLFVSTGPSIVQSFVRPFLEHSLSRFPLEIAPVIRLMRALLMVGFAQPQEYLDCLDILHKSSEYTDTLNLEFSSYETIDDVNNSDRFLIRLKSELPVFISKPGIHDFAVQSNSLVPFGQTRWHISSSIDASIIGEVRHHEPKPLIVTWEFGFNPIGYLMDCLATAVPGSRHALYASQEPLALEDTIDIIRLLSTVLLALKQNQGVEAFGHAHDLLNHRFCDADEEKDVITLVYELFECQLQEQGSDISIELLTVCVEFFHATAYFAANRVWSMLARSRLLDVNGTDPALVAVVTNFEMVNGSYGFLSSCLKLYNTMIDHAFSIPQSKGPSTKKSLSRLGQQTSTTVLPVLPKTSRTVMTVFTRILVSVFENCQFWRFDRRDEQSGLNVDLMSAFNRILVSAYGFDPEKSLDTRITHPLIDAAADLTDRFLSTNFKQSLTLPVLASISRPLPSRSMIMESQTRSSTCEIQTALKLCISILHIGTHLSRPQSALESHLFKAVPTLARLFAAVSPLKPPLASLFQVLLLAVPADGVSAPSLLVHMGASTAKSFLVLLTQVNQPLGNTERDLALWRLMTSVVSSRQQWFAFYLLTGRTPRETPTARKEDAQSNGCQSQPVFKYALDQISKALSKPAELITVHMLKFVAYSYNNWPWAVSMLREHPRFLTAITNYLGSLRRDDGAATIKSVMEALIAAEIAEILSMNLHTSRQLGDLQPALDLIQKLGYFKAVGFKPPFLNANMQHRLSSNVDDLYPGLKVSMFQHSQIFPTEYGNNFFYDGQTALNLMEAVAISGRKSKMPNHLNLIRDVEMANVDMSRMQAQLVLHGKCELLAAELAQISRLDDKFELMDLLMDIVQACLANVRGNCDLSASIIDKLELRRVDLIALVYQRLAEIRDPKKIRELCQFFNIIWKDVRELLSTTDTSESSEQAALRRQVIRIIFLIMQPLKNWVPSSQTRAGQKMQFTVPPAMDYAGQLIEVINEIVTKGFKSLANIVHQDQSACEPSDFAITTAVLQTVLKIPGVDNIHQQIALNLANSEVSRYAASLFSWSDQLLVDGDPIYGEHSILFLLELSSIAEMAETLAVEGVLSRLSSANLMALYTRKGGMGPFDKPTRLHSIWSKGILPLCLNLLDAVGGPIVPEVVSFLAQYPAQLDRLIRELQNRRNPIGPRPGDSYLTVNMASEAHSLSLIWRIVEHHRALGAAAAGSLGGVEIPVFPWDRSAAREEIEDWLGARSTLRMRLMAASERDSEWLRMKPSAKDGGKSESRLEERVWQELVGAAECLGAIEG
jgi:nuclear pore complex protein Nup188